MIRRALVVASAITLLCAWGPPSRAAEPEKQKGPDAAAPRPARPPASALLQKVIKVDEKTITVKPAMMLADGPEPVEETLRIDKDRTKVFIAEEKERGQDADGRTVTRGTFRAGTLADLKAGQTVRYRASEGLASEIRIMPKMPQPGGSRRGGEWGGGQN
jgi:hypothetical protein